MPYHFPYAEREREVTVERFGGVDFATHPTKVDLAHSPDACNLIAEETHFLVKRPGYKRVDKWDAPIYGLFAVPGEPGAAFVHAGSELYYLDAAGARTCLYEDMNEDYSTGFTMGGKLYLLDGKTYLVVYWDEDFEEWCAETAAHAAFVPTTTMAAPPAGGGTPYEAVNLLTAKRMNTFVGDGVSTVFYLDTKDVDSSNVMATVGGVRATISSISRKEGKVTLASPPPDAGGVANVAITFSKTVPAHQDVINRCRFAGLYGGKNDTRVFLSGNPDQPHCDWQSGLYEPTYFPDTGYTRVGSDASAIMGYVRQYESQLVIKQGGRQEATQYLRSFVLDEAGKAAYPLKQGAQGAGAAAYRTFAALGDTPLFLSETGVMGVFGTAVTEQRSIRRQSRAIDPRLTAEPGLKDACAIVWRDKYYLAVGERCYVADGRIFSADGSPEWYYWDNVPASCWAEIGGRLWFGTRDGRVCRFAASNEQGAFLDDGAPIDAWWRTPTLPLYDWGRVKTVREVTPVLMPYTRSGAVVTYEGSQGEEAALVRRLDQFSFQTLDFSRFSFLCPSGAQPLRVRRKMHREHTFSVRVRNNSPGEAFGLLALMIRYTEGARVH